ncbi:MAG: hypothetical protein ABIV10_08815 [Gemmatimonadaceae bacterium]
MLGANPIQLALAAFLPVMRLKALSLGEFTGRASTPTAGRRSCAIDAKTASPRLMTDERRFEELLTEFQRVGVDLHSFPAGITVRRDEAMRILQSLPDDAGPAAFLARIREAQQSRTPANGIPRQVLEARD